MLTAAELPAKTFLDWRTAQVDEGESQAGAPAEVAIHEEKNYASSGARSGYPNKRWARDYDPSLFQNRADCLLGNRVARLKAVSPAGEASDSPSRSVVLRYELEVRRDAVGQLNTCGASLEEGISAARNSDELRTCYL